MISTTKSIGDMYKLAEAQPPVLLWCFYSAMKAKTKSQRIYLMDSIHAFQMQNSMTKIKDYVVDSSQEIRMYRKKPKRNIGLVCKSNLEMGSCKHDWKKDKKLIEQDSGQRRRPRHLKKLKTKHFKRKTRTGSLKPTSLYFQSSFVLSKMAKIAAKKCQVTKNAENMTSACLYAPNFCIAITEIPSRRPYISLNCCTTSTDMAFFLASNF